MIYRDSELTATVVVVAMVVHCTPAIYLLGPLGYFLGSIRNVHATFQIAQH